MSGKIKKSSSEKLLKFNIKQHRKWLHKTSGWQIFGWIAEQQQKSLVCVVLDLKA